MGTIYSGFRVWLAAHREAVDNYHAVANLKVELERSSGIVGHLQAEIFERDADTAVLHGRCLLAAGALKIAADALQTFSSRNTLLEAGIDTIIKEVDEANSPNGSVRKLGRIAREAKVAAEEVPFGGPVDEVEPESDTAEDGQGEPPANDDSKSKIADGISQLRQSQAPVNGYQRSESPTADVVAGAGSLLFVETLDLDDEPVQSFFPTYELTTPLPEPSPAPSYDSTPSSSSSSDSYSSSSDGGSSSSGSSD